VVVCYTPLPRDESSGDLTTWPRVLILGDILLNKWLHLPNNLEILEI